MAPTSRRPATSLIEELQRNPESFQFFQAVRLLEAHAATQARDRPDAVRDPVGADGDPRHETVRFSAAVSLVHPTNEIVSLAPPEAGGPWRMALSFFGLVGPHGVLPEHYTEQLIEAARQKNAALRDFFDMLSHRSASFFYRSWARNYFPVAFERRIRSSAPADEEQSDLASSLLASAAGLSTRGLDGELPFGRPFALVHAGHLSNRRQSATALKALASELLDRPVEIVQFQGGWLDMEPDARTRLPSTMAPRGQHCVLGHDAVIGVRAWDVQSSFTIRVGPLDHEEFRSLMPDGPVLAKLAELVRFFCGLAQGFAVQPVLRAECVPPCKLGGSGAEAARLGWNTWMGQGPQTGPRDDAVFSTTAIGVVRDPSGPGMRH
jgi:type VI secretion system protein ImpH